MTFKIRPKGRGWIAISGGIEYYWGKSFDFLVALIQDRHPEARIVR
jgi:hypothetical protein